MWDTFAYGLPLVGTGLPDGPKSQQLCRRTVEDAGPYNTHSVVFFTVFFLKMVTDIGGMRKQAE